MSFPIKNRVATNRYIVHNKRRKKCFTKGEFIYEERDFFTKGGNARRWWLRLEGGRWEGPARSMGRCCFHAGVCVWRCVLVIRLACVAVCGCVCVLCDPSCSSCLAWFQVTQPFGGASGEGQYHPAGLVGTDGASCVLWGASGRRLCGWVQVNHSCWRTCTSQHGWGRWRDDWDVRVAGS